MKRSAIIFGPDPPASLKEVPGFIHVQEESDLKRHQPGLIVLAGGAQLSEALTQNPPCPVFRVDDDQGMSDFPVTTTELVLNGSLKRWFIQEMDVLAHVSHEMRSPMSVIAMASQLAQSKAITEERRQRHLELIDGAVADLKSLINDILDYSKLASGAFTLTVTNFRLERLLQDLVEGFALLAEERGIGLGLILVEGTPEYVEGDPGRLRQVLTNLLSNAIKFTSQGQVTLRVFQSEQLTFEVQDTGIGISPEGLQRIFVPYKQATDDTSSQYGGTGLGLSICRSLLQKMGGDIEVESQVGEGSCFRFSLPLEAVERAPQSKLSFLPPGLKLLFVSRQMPEEWEQMIRSRGLELHRLSPEEALVKIEAGLWFDLSIIELESWSFKRLERIEPQVRQAFGSVVLVTAAGQRGDAKLAIQFGARAYISLPFAAEKISRALLLCMDPVNRLLVTRYTIMEHYPELSESSD